LKFDQLLLSHIDPKEFMRIKIKENFIKIIFIKFPV